jgi:hypothetical protein
MWLDIVLGLVALIAVIDGVRRHWFLSLMKAFASLFTLFAVFLYEYRIKAFCIRSFHVSPAWGAVMGYLALSMAVGLVIGLTLYALKREKSLRRPSGIPFRILGACCALIGLFFSYLFLDLLLTENGWRDHLSRSLHKSRIATLVHRAETHISRPTPPTEGRK